MKHMKHNSHRMLYIALPACLLLGIVTQGAVFAQSFDPINELKSVLINRDYSQENFPETPGMLRAFLDSMQIDGVLQAFTIYEYESRKEGWKIWKDFDADRFRVPRLTAVVMRYSVPRNAAKQWRAIRDSINEQLKTRTCDFKAVSEKMCKWEWIPRSGYVLELEYMKPSKREKREMLEIRLKHGR
jgi:hypothetical protein